MTNKIDTLEKQISDLESLVAQGVLSGLEEKIKGMQAELDALLDANKEENPPAAQPSDTPMVSPEQALEPVNTNTQIVENNDPEWQTEASTLLSEVMSLKEIVRSKLLPEFADDKVAQCHLYASVAESFAEDRTHTLACEVPSPLLEQFNNANAYNSFKSIKSDQLNSRDIKAEQVRKKWATICSKYDTPSTSSFRNTAADKNLCVGSQIVTYSNAVKYTHNPENFLGHVTVLFTTTSLDGLSREVDEDLDLQIDEARMVQKRWYVKYKKDVLELAETMYEHKPVTLTNEQFKRYTLLLAIAKLWGEDQFTNAKAFVKTLALTNCKSDNEDFAKALREALDNAQALFVQPLTEMPSDTLIAELKKLKQNYSRQTLPSALEKINIKAQRKQIDFFGTSAQGYDVTILEQALAPFCKDPVAA